MKGICHIWSRGRHFSPSLPGDRYLKLGSKSDVRAEISGSIVRYDALAPRPGALLLCYFFGACAAILKLKFFAYSYIHILTTFAFTTDRWVSGIWHLRIWRQWLDDLAVPSYPPQKTIKQNFYSGKAVTQASNQYRWWNIVFSCKAEEDVFELKCSQGRNRCSDPWRRS